MADIVICEFLNAAALQQIPGHVTLLYDPTLLERPDELRGELAKARALVVRSYVEVTGELLDAGPHLEVVGRIGVGLNNVDLDACAARNITVVNAPGSNAISVGEYAVTAAMMLLRAGAYQGNAAVLDGSWPRGRMIGSEVFGKRFGVIGYGNTGRASVQRAAALGMSVMACDPYVPGDDPAWQAVERADLDGVLRSCDIVSLHVPLTDETRYIINAAALAGMKQGAIVINAARGGVVDEAALAKAMRSGHIAGAALDVFETEPFEAGEAGKFDGIENIILTPHIAGVTHESNKRTSFDVIRNLVEALAV
ncbi:MAG: hydroxyacid dehydrogenase [Rhizobiales bacterium]|nr:hydroxyacid dehydrogenase [Hyphomicrobiales bacterium]